MNQIATILRGDAQTLADWIRHWNARRFALCVAIIIAGAGCYGAAIGWWRSPQQALYTAIKCPLVMLLTAAGNGLLNGMFAPLLGVNISFRQSLTAVLMSFVITSAILGGFSPILAFAIWNAPPLAEHSPSAAVFYALIFLANILLIAFSGAVSNVRLVQLLRVLSGNPVAARRVLLAWLMGNLFLGSQLSWILRPFVGAPELAVQFLRPHPLKGSFYETVFHIFLRLFHSN